MTPWLDSETWTWLPADRGWVVVLQWGAAALVTACALVAAKAGAEPKAYLATLGGLALIALAGRWERHRLVRAVLPATACVACVAAVAAGWAFPLSQAETARLLERQHPADGPVRCVSPPRAGGYPEFDSRMFGRIYVCGYKKFGGWNDRGIRLGQGTGIEVDDTHIVRVYP